VVAFQFSLLSRPSAVASYASKEHSLHQQICVMQTFMPTTFCYVSLLYLHS
jgi:hypothetical protein